MNDLYVYFYLLLSQLKKNRKTYIFTNNFIIKTIYIYIFVYSYFA